MPYLLNRVQFTTATTGTGTITVGSASSGYRTPATAGASDGSIYRLVITDGNDWEISNGTAGSSATTFTRDLQSSSTGSLLNLSGSATVFIDAVEQDVNMRGKLTAAAYRQALL